MNLIHAYSTKTWIQYLKKTTIYMLWKYIIIKLQDLGNFQTKILKCNIEMQYARIKESV